MARVITFSTAFPGYHPKKGEPTYFVEKFSYSLWLEEVESQNLEDVFIPMKFRHMSPKNHTIRKGKRWKVGDKFSPRIWGTDVNPKSGKIGPYHSKQIILAPDIEIKKVFDIEIQGYVIFVNGEWFFKHGLLSRNDGLTLEDFNAWFRIPCNFSGQIICWNSEVEY